MKPIIRRRYVGLAVLAGLLLTPSLSRGQQARTVAGQVRDAGTQRPVQGAQVQIKGTTRGTLTNEDGEFLLSVPGDAETLVVTFIGYTTTEVPVTDQVTVDLEQQAIGLAGVVVTSLGLEREKRTLGYSVQDVSGLDLTQVPETNLVSSLQGLVSGVQITNAGPTGGSARIVIRGASSITGENQPLFIVDGIPVDNSAPRNRGFGPSSTPEAQGYSSRLEGIDYGNAIQDIDPNNIASVSVLKGPNAAALYGSRAANGAVVITTKSGQTSTGLSATSSLTFEEPLRLPRYQNQYGQGLFGEFQFVDGAGGGTWDFVDESWGPRLDGRPIDQFTGPGQPWLPHAGNVRNFFRTGSQWNTNVSLAQSSDVGHVRLSLTNSQVRGMAPGEQIDHIGLALRGGTELTDRLSAEASLNYTNGQGENRMGTGYDEDNPMQSFIWFGRQVDMDALRNYRCSGGEPTACDPSGGQYNWNYNYHNNPFWEQLVNGNEDQRDRLLGHVSTTYQVNDWITATGIVGRDLYREHRKKVVAFNSLDDAGDGEFAEERIFNSEINADLIVSASRQLTPDVTLDITAGGNLRYNRREQSDVFVAALSAPGVYTIDNAKVAPQASDYLSRKAVRSLYGSASVNYRGWLNVDLTGRNDWSSTLPPGKNSYFYPSVSGSLIFTDALAIESGFLSSGKVRASWTRVGNDADPYQLAAVYSAQQPFGNAAMFAVPNRIANANLKPEETTAWEVGTDLGFLNERLGFVLTYYKHSTRNQILPVQISRATGYEEQVLNAGEVRNSGLELLLRTTPVLTDDVQWDVTVNWSKNDSEVKELYQDLETLVLGEDYWSLNAEARVGVPYGTLYGNGYLRCTDDLVEDGDCSASQLGLWMLDANGLPQPGERRVLGNYNPDWLWGVQNRFSYGPLSLSVLVDGQQGGEIFSVTKWFGEYSGVLESSLYGRENDWDDPGIVVEGVLPDGSLNGDGTNDVTAVSQDYFGANFGIHEAGIVSATYVKLREIRLGYALPQSLMSRIGFSGGDIALIGRNLALWSDYEDIDPETAFDASNTQGFEFGQLPTARSFGVSISVRP